MTGRETVAAIQASVTTNAGTNEQLLIQKPWPNVLLIGRGRCPAELDGKEWAEGEGRKIFRNNRGQTTPSKNTTTRKISVLYPSIGSAVNTHLLNALNILNYY
jgi:hypothetical protein